MKVCFLYNHDAAHQVAHSISIAAVLSEIDRDKAGKAEVWIAYCADNIKQEIDKFLTPHQSARINWLDLRLKRMGRILTAPLNRLVPIRRIARLYLNRKTLRGFDVIVSTERTCLTLKRHWRGKGPKFVFVPHGAGDRSVTYHKAMAGFDEMFVSGQKVADQMIAHGLTTQDKCTIIGYPKFDQLVGRKPAKLFPNDNPTFLYNPHFDPMLSSWYDHGPDILEWFAKHPQYNLIFAPHVMLFFKKLHISPEYKISRQRPDIDPKLTLCPNILIDTNSARLFDMTYTRAADAYIGDVSSQIYEFLYRPRAAFFIDTHTAKLRCAPYEFWENGPVAKNSVALTALLPHFESVADKYRARQTELMAYTAHQDPNKTAGERGAAALIAMGKNLDL